MIKFFVIGDPHFKENNVIETDKLLKESLKIIENNNFDFTVIAGDVLDRFDTYKESSFNRAQDFIDKIRQKCKTYVLIGNHDLINNSQFMTNKHAFNALKKWDNCKIVDYIIEEEIKGKRIIFCPYVPKDRFIEALDYIDNWQQASMIFAHQEVYGAKMSKVISKHSTRWLNTYPYLISGHIHDYQKINDNVIYVGTPFQQNFGEVLNKTVSIFLFEDNKLTEERVELGISKKIVVDITYDEIETVVFDSDASIKIRIHEKKSGELKNIDKHPKILEWRKLGYLIQKELIKEKKTTCASHSEDKNFTKLVLDKISSDEELYNIWKEIIEC